MIKIKYYLFLTILLIVMIFAIGCTSEVKQTRDDFGCFSSCSTFSDQFGKQMCENWKTGKTVQWPPDCSIVSDYPGCMKLCETEKKVGTQSGSQQTTSAPEQKQAFNVLPSLINAEFANDVSEEDKNFVIRGISAIDFYLKQRFGKSINQPAMLRVYAAESTPIEGGAKVEVETGKMVILIGTKSDIWKSQIELNKQMGGDSRNRISAHEYVHVYQFHNGCGNAASEDVPAKWFVEGEAEWLSYKAIQEAGLIPSFSIPQMLTAIAKQETDSLKSFEKVEKGGLTVSRYSFYTMAVDYLMKGKSIKALDDFCANLAGGKGMSMPKAFETAFGISLDKFYDDFESYRKTWSSESSSGQSQIPKEYCVGFTAIPSCSYVGAPDSQNYKYCKQCYPDK